MDKDYEGEVVFPTMSVKTRKLNYTIHNPNGVEKTAEVLLGIFVQVNEGKIERKIKKILEEKENIVRKEVNEGVGI